MSTCHTVTASHPEQQPTQMKIMQSMWKLTNLPNIPNACHRPSLSFPQPCLCWDIAEGPDERITHHIGNIDFGKVVASIFIEPLPPHLEAFWLGLTQTVYRNRWLGSSFPFPFPNCSHSNQLSFVLSILNQMEAWTVVFLSKTHSGVISHHSRCLQFCRKAVDTLSRYPHVPQVCIVMQHRRFIKQFHAVDCYVAGTSLDILVSSIRPYNYGKDFGLTRPRFGQIAICAVIWTTVLWLGVCQSNQILKTVPGNDPDNVEFSSGLYHAVVHLCWHVQKSPSTRACQKCS